MGEHGLRVEGQVGALAAAQAVVAIATARGGTKGVNSGQQRVVVVIAGEWIYCCVVRLVIVNAMTLFIITEFATM